ncbi:antitoxin Xre-like helix-turn-helix domain-containing protein [Cohaesibacter haloalkalitolerans]|uniref:antitoxin Xre-like helix-turn-helix domain-containing protein n=1 Tax=Cohaesibacter haloalkalitolerans TaxID=1162980 RepID=UPI000E65CD23|nr:antitoxin Xre-like helix-turn-helix domain-containing protein [Cohaesibacter haloalkalitolerans]
MVTPFDGGKQITSAPAFATRLGITQAELAKLTGIDRRSFYRQSGLRKLDEAVRPLMSILNLASEMTGSDQRAALWFKHQPIPGWAGKTAFDLVLERKSDRVLAYLKSVQSGVYS